MPSILNYMIYVHAILGGFALITGSIALLSKKGSSRHKKMGIYFFYTMLSSAILALIIALLPNHKNPFLFSIGIFSCYLLLSGYRALNFKNNKAQAIDKFISLSMLITGGFMIIFPIITQGKINLILSLFGITGGLLSFNDMKLYMNSKTLNTSWLKLHIGKMTGAYISAATAFIVVNNLIPGVYGWLIPGILGGLYIRFSIRSLNS